MKKIVGAFPGNNCANHRECKDYEKSTWPTARMGQKRGRERREKLPYQGGAGQGALGIPQDQKNRKGE